MNAPTSLAPVRPGRIHVLEIVGNAIVGGMETCVERLIERLPREQFAVTVLAPSEGAYAARLRALGAEVLVTPIPDDPIWPSIQLLCSLIRSNGIDVLHAHLPNAHALAGIVGQLTGTPVLTTIHGRQVSMFDLEIHRITGSHIAVLCQQSYFHALGIGVSAAQLSCIPNGIDTDVFHPKPAVSVASGQAVLATGLRGEFGIPADAPLVGFVGRLSPEKGPEVFLRSALLVQNSAPRAHFVLVGDGPMRERLGVLQQRYALGDRVHLAGVRSDMPEIYHQFDFLVASSYSEAMPLAVMEAMASGLPVIATRVGGVPEMIAEGQTGWVVDPGSFEAIAACATQLLDSPELLCRMGAAARQHAVERFELAHSVARTAEVLTRLASSGAEARRLGTLVAEAPRKLTRAPRNGADVRAEIRPDRSA